MRILVITVTPTPSQIILHNPLISRSLILSHLQRPFCHGRSHIHRFRGLGCGPFWGPSSTCLREKLLSDTAVSQGHPTTSSCSLSSQPRLISAAFLPGDVAVSPTDFRCTISQPAVPALGSWYRLAHAISKGGWTRTVSAALFVRLKDETRQKYSLIKVGPKWYIRVMNIT